MAIIAPVMTTTRRTFLAVSGVASASLLLPVSISRAAPAGSRRPAPPSPPIEKERTAAAIAGSPLPALRGLAHVAIETATKAGAGYADARLVRWQTERVSVRDDHLERVERRDEIGIGVRVLVDGAWGYAATHELRDDAVATAARQAVATARRSAKLLAELKAPRVELSDEPPVKGQWVAPHRIDPFSVAPADKAALLSSAARKVLSVPGIRHAAASVYAIGEDKLLVTSEGTEVHQIYFRLHPALEATAIDGRRGRFATRDHEAAPMLAGWEYVVDLGLEADAPQIAEDALRKLYAPSVKPGKRHVVLAPSNLWLTIHESIGHSTELDRAMGLEANFAGTSFIRPDDAGKLRIGSDTVTLVADRTQPGGLATTAWDDDGVAAGRWDIVRDGIFVGWQTTRDQATWIGEERSRGCSYGEGYRGLPFQRMPNVSLQPGKEGYTTEDLINATEDGVLVTGRGSWSIDHQRYNFQFSGQMFWEIKRGRVTTPLRDVAYQANTIDFWKSCDMIGGKGTYRLGGSFGDGKGEPSQSNAVSHGCPPARFIVNVVNTGGDR